MGGGSGGAKPLRVAGVFARTEMMLLSYHSSPVRAAATVCEMPAGSPSVPAAGAPPDDAVKYIGGARGPQRWEEDGRERFSSVGVSWPLFFRRRGFDESRPD